MNETEWNVAEAKSRFSEMLNRADAHEPQIIRRRSKDYILLTGEDYRKLTGEEPDFLDHLLNGPSLDELELPKRGRDAMREVSL